MNIIDAYYKQNISYKHGKSNLVFKVSQDLFSSAVIDHGTQRLLRTLIFENITSYKKALDLGCGYGPIGVALKATCPTAEVHMVDPDALALEYSKENTILNNVGEVKVYGSLGYESINDNDFDLIVSNIPAKVGEPVLRHIIKDAQYFLSDAGKVVIVVIDAIAEFIHQELVSDENIEILYHRAWPGHHVYHYRFLQNSHLQHVNRKDKQISSEFYRHKNVLKFKGKNIEVDTTHNLPEFDTLSFDTDFLLKNLNLIKGQPKNIYCTNPGQGYVPLALLEQFNSDHLFIVDRDLLALRTTRHNLLKNGVGPVVFQMIHSADFKSPASGLECAVCIVPEKLGIEVYKKFLDQVFDQVKNEGQVLLCSSSTVITRIEELLLRKKGIEKLTREKNRGQSLLLLKKL